MGTPKIQLITWWLQNEINQDPEQKIVPIECLGGHQTKGNESIKCLIIPPLP